MLNNLGHGKDHRLGITGLATAAVYIKRHIKILRVRNVVAGHQPRPGWAKGVAGFTLGPLPRQIRLKMALRDVIDDAIACNILQGIGFADIFSRFTDHHAKFDFPICADRPAWHRDIIIGSNNRRVGFEK